MLLQHHNEALPVVASCAQGDSRDLMNCSSLRSRRGRADGIPLRTSAENKCHAGRAASNKELPRVREASVRFEAASTDNDVSAPKALDNAIINYVRMVGKAAADYTELAARPRR